MTDLAPMRKYMLVVGLCVGVVLMAMGQKSRRLILIPVDRDTSFLTKGFAYPRTYNNQAHLNEILNDLVSKLYDKSYLAASVDSIVEDSNQTKAILRIGPAYEWVRLRNGNIDEGLLSQVGFRERLYRRKPFRYSQVRKLQEAILRYAENNGHPFAVVKLDSFSMDSGQVRAAIFLQKNQLIRIDSLSIEGNARISKRYLYHYFGIQPGGLYNEAQIRRIPVRIKELSFLGEERPLNIAFYKEKATVNLFLKPRKASKFNFLIGFLPNNEATGRLLVTGEAEVKLQNAFGAGEFLMVEWRRLKTNTTDLDARFTYPYLPLLPFGVDFSLDLYRNDTIFWERGLSFGFQYNFTGGNYLKAFVENEISRLITVDTILVKSTKILPDRLDITRNFYGLEYQLEKLDYRLNPRKGFAVRLNGKIGKREILRNPDIIKLEDDLDPDFDFNTLYDSIRLKTTQYEIHYGLDQYFPLTARSVIKVAVNGAALISQDILSNELFRIGGNHLLRGFDEESIRASFYNILTLEYRFLLGQNSYFYLFGDAAYLENEVNRGSLVDRPFGFGAGMTFETKAGLFAVAYALGRQLDNPIDLRSAKIHFGYVNYF